MNRRQPVIPKVQDEKSKQSFDQIVNILNTLQKNEVADGVYLENVEIIGSFATIEHKLNRKYRGYIICSKSAQSDIWDQPTGYEDKFIKIYASNPCTLKIWVF